MTYENMSIKEAIKKIDGNEMFLPALQRKFVWDKTQIELLFDSIMRNYPIGTFLFWKLHNDKASDYVFYEFLKDYKQNEPYNRLKTGKFVGGDGDRIIGILDGQQRLSSMYVGLMGTHTEKKKFARSSNIDAYVKTSLHLNLLSLPYKASEGKKTELIEEQNFEFRFLADEVATETSRKSQPPSEEGERAVEEPVCWLKVGDVLGWGEELDLDWIYKGIVDSLRDDKQKDAIKDNKRKIKYAITKLHDRMHKEKLISYFTIEKNDLEDILKIFVRVNSGGTVLNKTDLLFSTIVATWEDGREKIEELMKLINSKGDGFSFGNEYLMRCCLMLTDGPSRFKVNSFKSENVGKIKSEWDNIAAAISKTVDLLNEFGYSGSLLSSQNATLVIAYHIFKGGSLDQVSKDNIRKYLSRALLKRVYSSSQEQVLQAFRNALRKKKQTSHEHEEYELANKSFSFDAMSNALSDTQKSLKLAPDDINNFLEFKKGGDAFLVLALLYPNLKYAQTSFHQDHIHPRALFKDSEFDKFGMSKEDRDEWLDLRDRVPNLQMLEGSENQSKNATPLVDWVHREYDDNVQQLVDRDYFPDGVSLEFSEFKAFYDKREAILHRKLTELLEVETVS